MSSNEVEDARPAADLRGRYDVMCDVERVLVCVLGNEGDRRVREQLAVVRAVADREHARGIDAGECAVREYTSPLRETERRDRHTVTTEVAVSRARIGMEAQRREHVGDD